MISLVTGGKINPQDRGILAGLGGGRGGAFGGGRQELRLGRGMNAGRAATYKSRYGDDYSDSYRRGYGEFLYGGQGGRHGANEQRGGGPLPVTYVKRMLKPNMLYLMIVNMPTEEEMEEARAILTGSQK